MNDELQTLESASSSDAQRQLDHQARLFETTLSTISDFAYTFDLEGRFVYVNKALLDLWGLPLSAAVGKNFFDLKYPDALAERLQRQIQEVIATRRQLVDETPYTSPTGAGGYYEYIFRPVINARGEVEAVAGSTRDITARKRTEEQLRDAQARLAQKAGDLEKLNKNLEEFTHIVSHDLQSPLNKIISFGDLLKADAGTTLSERGRRFLDRMQQAAERGSQLMASVLRYAKTTSARDGFEPVDMNRVLDEVLSDLDIQIEAASAEIKRGALPMVLARRGQMHQLLLNLLGNSLKYRDERAPVLQISASGDGPLSTFRVKDNGLGMDPADLGRIFDLFHRINRPGKEGSGVGLAICRKLVETHGGTIWVDSSPAKGSTFYFTLPKA